MIKIICEKRHHKGEPDISYPAIFCDVCGERITDHKANYYWTPDYKVEKDEFYEAQWQPLFAHCECDMRIQATYNKRKEHFDIKTPMGTIVNSEDILSGCNMSIENFVLYTSRNIGMNVSARDLKRTGRDGDYPFKEDEVD